MKIGYNMQFFKEYGVKAALEINLKSHPSLLLTGASGTGKSYALKFLIKNLLQEEKVNLTFCNFKDSEDFSFLADYDYYHTFEACGEGLEGFYQRFKYRQTQGSKEESSELFNILVFDEFPAFILYETQKDKKKAESYKNMVAELLMLGRSYGFGLWVVMQRPDASFLPSGARDNFHTLIALGNLSKESRSMLFTGEELGKDITFKQGEGLCLIDGTPLLTVKFPKILDLKGLEDNILSGLASG